MTATIVHLDESPGDHPFLACGWAAKPEHWRQICDKWQGVLDEKRKLKYFRMNSALGLKDPFEGWSEIERDRKLVALAQVLPHDGTIFGVGCHVRREDFDELKSRIPRKALRDPYYFSVAITMIYPAASEQQIVGPDKIDFVLDKNLPAERMTRIFYSDLKPYDRPNVKLGR